MRFISTPVAVDFEDWDMGWVIFLRHRVERQDAGLLPDGGVDLLLDGGPVCIQLHDVDLDLRHLHVLPVRLLSDCTTAQRRNHHGCPENKKLLYVHLSSSLAHLRYCSSATFSIQLTFL